MKIQRITYLSLGANQGNKLENIQNAINLIADKIGLVLKIASVYETISWGFDSDNFYNTCIKVSTYLPPEKLIQRVLNIEKKLGRIRTHSKEYVNRLIDIDILLFDNQIIYSKDLIVPHPKMLNRKFTLVPLTEIAGSFIHPVKKKQLSICLANCTDDSGVSKADVILNRPVSISEKHDYIAIERNIGIGKLQAK